ncbi:hypothetical protein C8E00_10217 [Chromohalobacter marismortui]|uniref:Uncharacterized protein n=1 Tax=Chromohalobacter marismortui TaxID=42055 RepID=A0A4R7NSX2_9GAMM|nr:hypothetical protein C8E00_10217 [Chromohalobacter marismortui]
MCWSWKSVYIVSHLKQGAGRYTSGTHTSFVCYPQLSLSY